MKKRIPEPIEVKFKMPHLYRGDLQAIECILKDELHVKSFSIAVRHYTEWFQYDSVEEIEKGHIPVHDIWIVTHYPHVSIELFGFSAELSCPEDSINSAGAISKISGIIKRGERSWRSLSESAWVTLLGCVVLGLLLGKVLSFDKNVEKSAVISILVFLLLLIWLILQYVWSVKTFSLIEFINKKEETSFWIRKRDDILSDILKITVGIILGAIANHFLHW